MKYTDCNKFVGKYGNYEFKIIKLGKFLRKGKTLAKNQACH